MRNSRAIAAAVAVFVVGTLGAPLAFAADGGGGSSAVSATITAGAIGERSVTTVAPITMSSLLDSATLSSSLSVLVTEAARTGTNPWSVTGDMSDLSDGTNTIGNAALAVSGRDVLQVASGGTSSAPAGSQDFSATRTLFSNAGQSETSVYTGTHTASGTVTLTPPNGTVAGVYTGTFTVTLVQ